MLTPSELRQRGKGFIAEAETIPIGPDPPAWVYFYTGTLSCLVADLCDQVAELRERCSLTGNPTVTITPAPRILKASEITEPGWYGNRRINEKCEWVISKMNPLHEGLLNAWRNYEFYGPIQLPE